MFLFDMGLIDFDAVVPLLRFLSFSAEDPRFAFDWGSEVSIPLSQDVPIRREPRSEGFAVDFNGFTLPSANFVIHRADPSLCAAGIPPPTDNRGLRSDNVPVPPVSFDTAPRIAGCSAAYTNFTPSQIVTECNIGEVRTPRRIVRAEIPPLSTIPTERASDA